MIEKRSTKYSIYASSSWYVLLNWKEYISLEVLLSSYDKNTHQKPDLHFNSGKQYIRTF